MKTKMSMLTEMFGTTQFSKNIPYYKTKLKEGIERCYNFCVNNNFDKKSVHYCASLLGV